MIFLSDPGFDAATASPRERILRAGVEILACSGLAEVNTNSVARAAGVGVGTFYAHFEDKFALHRALMAAGLAALQEVLARANASSEGAAVEAQVRASVEAFVDFARDNPALFRVLFAGERPGTARARVGFSTRATENRLRGLQEAGHLDSAVDPAAAARVFHAGQGQILLWWLDAPESLSRPRLVETLARLHPALACRR